MPFRMVPAFLRFTWLFFHQTEWLRLGHFPLNSQCHLREPLYVRAQMGCFAPENVSLWAKTLNSALCRQSAISLVSFCPFLSPSLFFMSTSDHNSVAQLTLLRSLQGVSVLCHTKRLPSYSPILLLFLRHTDPASRALTACFIQWPLPNLCLRVMLSLHYFFIQCFFGSGLLWPNCHGPVTVPEKFSHEPGIQQFLLRLWSEHTQAWQQNKKNKNKKNLVVSQTYVRDYRIFIFASHIVILFKKRPWKTFKAFVFLQRTSSDWFRFRFLKSLLFSRVWNLQINLHPNPTDPRGSDPSLMCMMLWKDAADTSCEQTASLLLTADAETSNWKHCWL